MKVPSTRFQWTLDYPHPSKIQFWYCFEFLSIFDILSWGVGIGKIPAQIKNFLLFFVYIGQHMCNIVEASLMKNLHVSAWLLLHQKNLIFEDQAFFDTSDFEWQLMKVPHSSIYYINYSDEHSIKIII